MPQMNGIELAGFIRHQHRNIPLILLNTPGDERYKEYPDLFKSILTKPIRQHLLHKCISNELYQEVKKPTELSNGKPKLSAEFSKEYPLRILVAEDNAINQQVALGFLNKLGYQPELAQNGQQALEMVSELNYDLILMDVRMPIMDGLEATRMIRLCLNTQPVIIAMTANAMQGDRQECLNAGVDDYISKPIKFEELFKMLEKWAIQVNDKK